MAPKKRARTSNVKLDTMFANAKSMDEICEVQRKLKDWVVKTYSMRHGATGSEKLPWPLQEGGSFLEVTRRVWGDKDSFLSGSLELVLKLGLMAPGSTIEDFKQKYFLKDSTSCSGVPRFLAEGLYKT